MGTRDKRETKLIHCSTAAAATANVAKKSERGKGEKIGRKNAEMPQHAGTAAAHCFAAAAADIGCPSQCRAPAPAVVVRAPSIYALKSRSSFGCRRCMCSLLLRGVDKWRDISYEKERLLLANPLCQLLHKRRRYVCSHNRSPITCLARTRTNHS